MPLGVPTTCLGVGDQASPECTFQTDAAHGQDPGEEASTEEAIDTEEPVSLGLEAQPSAQWVQAHSSSCKGKHRQGCRDCRGQEGKTQWVFGKSSQWQELVRDREWQRQAGPPLCCPPPA